jgi:hypothetical protein
MFAQKQATKGSFKVLGEQIWLEDNGRIMAQAKA